MQRIDSDVHSERNLSATDEQNEKIFLRRTERDKLLCDEVIMRRNDCDEVNATKCHATKWAVTHDHQCNNDVLYFYRKVVFDSNIFFLFFLFIFFSFCSIFFFLFL